MNYKMMGRFVAQILGIEGVFMIPALCISLYCQESAAVRGFVWSMVLILILVGILHTTCRKGKKRFYAREGMVCVGLSWIIMSVMGALPFYISGEIPSFIDCFFEIVSGFTTTGASILSDVESLSKGILYWRSFSHWLGGMGVLVFLLAISSLKGMKGGYTMHLLRAESPGPNVGKLVPKMKRTAEILYVLYILLTILNILFLLAGRMPLFDAVCTAMGTAGTGGFGIKNDSIAGYSPYIQNVCTVFMLLFGVNFSCYYLILIRQFKTVWKDEELRMYIGVVFASTALITVNIYGFYNNLGESIRHAAFQVASIVTTTGFATTDFDLWPSFSKAIMLCLMVIGASAGSTGGGFKCGRALLLFKNMRRNIKKALNPRRVEVVSNNGQMMDEAVLSNINTYLAAYVMILIGSFLLVSIDGFSTTTNFSAVLSCFNNIGPGLELVGPTSNYGGYSVLSKLVLIFDMLAGRLEIFPILILLTRSTWKKG